ncbi:hypothetical protein P43SY_011219 [Pythium insidiosum]|uniref:Uncharacterized protein n=1 Tax=Pythium insidiosum TaxID=114742 RepID=A0AAD5L7Z5_PYTIN|nr:hypothetical protein P43SY_011219 [Pythium insidiosum]
MLRKASVDLRNKVQPVLEPPAVQEGKLEREQAKAEAQAEAAVEAAIVEGLVDTEPVSGAARPDKSVDVVLSPSEGTGEANKKQQKQDDVAEDTADAPVERAEA